MAAYVVPAPTVLKPEHLWEFTIGEQTFSVPRSSYIPLGVLEAADEHGVVGFTNILAALEMDDALAAVRGLDTVQLTALVTAWLGKSGATALGESKASTD